ncbi:MAG: hypothetical protein NUW09_09660 [Deltaproteobacteria bacterium]|nr:hypothetical protein [Deltaproteobacteria bacterium]
MVGTIVFLFDRPLVERDTGRYGFEYLKSQGFEVYAYDLSLLVNKDAALRQDDAAVAKDHIVNIRSYEEFDKNVRRLAGRAVFIDYLVGLSRIDLRNERVFRILKKHGAKYAVISAGALPLSGVSHRSGIQKAKRALNPGALLNFIAKKAIFFLSRHRLIYPLPAIIFSGETLQLKMYLESRSMQKVSVVVPIHSLDHDTYLHYIRGMGNRMPEPDNTCVFLDEAATHHPDFAFFGIRPLVSDDYFQMMRLLFDTIEKKTGLKVIVAAHPRSQYEDMSGIFGARPVVKDRTAELVAKSSLVLAHSSTSISFAVLSNKPLLFIKTPGMRSNGTAGFVDTMAASLGLESYGIDSTESFEKIPLDYSRWVNAGYDDYKYKYIKSKGLGDVTVWEAVAGYFKKHGLN